ncbi:MAG: hypothetical protein PHQ27_04135 [Victivallales bacterium]|nr:hypothetical protein [Victivallales bacterium]
MNSLAAAIGRELENCRELLRVFQEERRLYGTGNTIGLAEVTALLERKQQLVAVFDRQHLLMKELRHRQNDANTDPAAEPQCRELLRTLGSVLEQLLVIDHENEKLLRDNITTRHLSHATTGKAAAPSETMRRRPALQQQLPFVPGLTRPGAAIATTVQPTAKSTAKPIATRPGGETAPEPARTMARHLLRRYTRNGTVADLASKYA